MNGPRRSTLAIADDHELVARGLAQLLAPFYDVPIIAHSGRALLRQLAAAPVNGILLDLSMPEESGLDVLPKLKRRHPDTRILVVSMHADRTLVQTTLGLGAHGYVPKDADLSELRTALDTVLAGGRYVSTRIPRHSEHSGLQALHPSLASLSPQQERVLLLIGEGLSSAAIGRTMGLAEATIAFHRANIRRKLGIENELGLHRFAVLIQSADRPVAPTRAASGGLPRPQK
jgi:two-component system NarL family response regulator